jgi:hypothetical protein
MPGAHDEGFRPMRNRSFRPIAVALSILFLTGVPTKAGPVVVSDVVQVLSSYQNPPELRVRSVSQNSMAVSRDARGNLVQSKSAGGPGSTTVLSGTEPSDESLLGLVAISNTGQEVGVDIIDAGDVEGAVCDCGEIPVEGGLPWWPLLFLAAVPLFFIHDCEDCKTPNPNPTPTPTPPPVPSPSCVNCTPSEVPEPAALILFGSGLLTLGAGLRRRYARSKLTQVKAEV